MSPTDQALPEGARAVLDYWFGELRPGELPAEQRIARWFRRSPQQDEDCRARFAAVLDQAAAGELEAWEATPRGRLALVIVLDQFSREIHRDTPRAFAQDGRAREVALRALERGDDRTLHPVERAFLYLTFEHAEDLTQQERCLALYQGLRDEAPPEHEKLFANWLDYARRHHDIVARFGRFPHRNAILGRSSTPEELEFLAQPGSSF